ncbi:MAG: hypothetical protein D0531_05210 [Methylococcales bacterium]|nr:MAG: hypothetical protein D0531_05210 [Methylococcales bacterium]
MDVQTTINLVGGAILAVIGWFARQLYQSVKDLQTDIRKIEVSLPTSYVSKTDFNDTMREIRNMFEKIFDKLDNKADK